MPSPFCNWSHTTPDGLVLVGEKYDGDGPLLILSHGGGQTRASWSRSLPRLREEGFAILSYDLRGHGQSGWSAAGAYTFQDYVGDLVSIVTDVREKNPIILIGASLGGIASLITSARIPESIAALVLIDVGPRVHAAGADRIRSFMKAHQQGFASVEAASAALTEYRPGVKRSRDLEGLRRSLRRDESGGRYFWHWDPKIVGAMSARQARAEVMSEACKSVRAPILLVRGMQSDVVTEAEVLHFRSLVPNLTVEDVSEAGHIVVGDRNDAFLASVSGFLSHHLQLKCMKVDP